MTYNVFGGTLNPAQPNPVVLVLVTNSVVLFFACCLSFILGFDHEFVTLANGCKDLRTF